MGKKEFFVYDKTGWYDNPLKAMKGLPIAKEASDVGYDIVCGAVAKENIDTLYTLFLGGIYPAEAHISKGAKGIILCDEFGISDIPERAYVPLLLRHNIKFVELSQFAGRFSYDSMFEDFPIKWDGIDYEPPGINFTENQVDYVASKTTKLHCPAENKAGNTDYEILEAKEQIDTDGSILGVALAKSEHQYVTWDYTYFPKSDFFNGFNNGHYYDADSAAAAIHDFDNRCKERFSLVKENKGQYKEIAPVEETSEEEFDREKLKEEILEKIEYAFRHGFANPNYFTVYVDFDTGRPYIDEEVDENSCPTDAYFGKDFSIYRYGGYGQPIEDALENSDEEFLESLELWLDDDERTKYEEWLQSDEFKELKEYEEYGEPVKEKIEWLQENTNAYEVYCDLACDNEFLEFADEADKIAEDAIDTWEELVQEENAAETSFDINECDEPDYWEMMQLAEKEALEEAFEDIEPGM